MNCHTKSKLRLLAAVVAGPLVLEAQRSPEPRAAENAALRYWPAFVQMRDSSVSADQAKELQAILNGTAPYSSLKYRELVDRNSLAIETMQRGAALAQCDWGLEYQRGSEAPLEHVGKALALGRLNILYSMHQLQIGKRSGGIQALAGGLRFAHDVAAGGPLMAALAAKTLLVSHLRAIDFAGIEKALTPDEKALLAAALDRVGPEAVDWGSAMQREFEVVGRSGTPVPAAVEDLYRRALQDAAQLAGLQRAIALAPPSVAARIADPRRVFEQKRELDQQLEASRRLLRK